MNTIFFDGFDELYHHAKFGEDRITRAGCRCENVVFVTMFLSATRSIEPISYSNVSGWLTGWLSVRTPYADTKFQGNLKSGAIYIHGGRKNWRFSTEMADISETVRDRTMVTMER